MVKQNTKKSRVGFSYKKYTLAFWVLVAPCIIFYTTFFLIPLLFNIAFSFTNYDGWKTMDFVGLKNYVNLFTSNKNFYFAIGRTLVYTLINIPFKIAIPLLLATLFTSTYTKAKSFSRTLIYIPVLFSALIVGVTINWMFGQEYGLINFIIQSFGGKPLEWALNSTLATSVISIASNWASAGFFMVIFIGGINNISAELYEAGSIDGATGLQAFFRITLPMLSPTTFLVMLLATINLLKEFALVQGITQGGPGLQTTFIIQYIYKEGIEQGRYGYGSAISVVVMLLFICIASIQFKVSKGGEMD